MQSYKQEVPGKIEISGYSYNKNAAEMEQFLHNRYAPKRLEGEWFDLSNDDVASIHHYFETHYLDEYLAPLSEEGVKLAKIRQRRRSDERILNDLKDFKSFKIGMYILLFFNWTCHICFYNINKWDDVNCISSYICYSICRKTLEDE